MAYGRPTLVQGTAASCGTANPVLATITGAVPWSTVADGTQLHYLGQENPPSANFEWGLGTKTTVGGNAVLVRTAANILNGTAGAGALTNFTGAQQIFYTAPLGEVEVLPNATSDPAVASPGQMVFRTDLGTVRAYTGTSWVNLAGVALPVADTTAVVFNTGDNTKQIRFSLNNITSGNTRILAVQDTNYTLAGLEAQNVFNQSAVSIKGNTANYLTIAPNETLTANRTLNLVTGDSSRTLTFTGNATISGTNTGDQTINLTGDVTGVGTGAFATTIGPQAVTYAKIQNVSGTSTILGRKSGGAGSPEECTLSNVLDFVGSAAQGDIFYRGASTWARLPAGTIGQVLVTEGANQNPVWASIAGMLPVSDATVILQGAGDPTKQLKFALGGFTSGQTRTLTPQDANYTIAGLETANVFNQTAISIKSNTANTLTIKPNENLSANRTLSIVMNDASWTLSLAANATVSGTNTGDQTITVTGDVSGSGTGSFGTTIQPGVVTYAKMQNVSATSTILGRKSAGAGSPEECTLSNVLDFIGSAAQGDIFYRGAATWARLPAGTLGQYLQTQGAGANPAWVTSSAALPVLDSTSVVKGSADNTKQVAISAAGLTTGTTRTLTVQDANYTLAGWETPNIFAQTAVSIKGATANALTIKPNETLTAGRTLNVITGDSTRTLTFTADTSIGGTNTGDQTITLTGDVTGTGTGSFASTIGSQAVTYAKMQNMSGTSLILGRSSAGAGSPQECTLSQVLDFVGSATQGDILYRGNSTWARLGAGSSGQFLQTQGAGQSPQWANTQATFPIADTTVLLQGSADATKQVQFSLSSVGHGQTRTLTVQDANYTLAGTNLSNTFSATQTFNQVPVLPAQAPGVAWIGPPSGGNAAPTFRALALTDLPMGATPPYADSTALVKGAGDATKQLQFNLAGFTTGNVNTLTPQNASYTIAGLETNQTFTGFQTYKYTDSSAISVPILATFDHESTAGTSNNFGAGIQFLLKSSTTASRQVAEMDWSWFHSQDNVRIPKMVWSLYGSDGLQHPFMTATLDSTGASYVGISGIPSTTFSQQLTVIASADTNVGLGIAPNSPSQTANLTNWYDGFGNVCSFVGPSGQALFGVNDANVNGITAVGYVRHRIYSGNQAQIVAGMGGGLQWQLDDLVNTGMPAGDVQVSWIYPGTNLSDAGRLARMTLGVRDGPSNTFREGVRIDTNGSAAFVGIGGAVDPVSLLNVNGEAKATDWTPVGLTGATAASRYVGATTSGSPASGTFAKGDFIIDQTGLVWICTTAGSPGTWLKATGATTSLPNLFTALQTFQITDAVTNSITQITAFDHESTGNPAVGFGGGSQYLLASGSPNATASRLAFEFDWSWATAVDASRKSRGIWYAQDNAGARECLRMESNGSAGMLGFLGSAAIPRQVVSGLSSGATASLVSALAAFGLITDSTTPGGGGGGTSTTILANGVALTVRNAVNFAGNSPVAVDNGVSLRTDVFTVMAGDFGGGL
jgi:Repeat of unknown function (DUF5907)